MGGVCSSSSVAAVKTEHSQTVKRYARSEGSEKDVEGGLPSAGFLLAHAEPSKQVSILHIRLRRAVLSFTPSHKISPCFLPWDYKHHSPCVVCNLPRSTTRADLRLH